MRAINTFASNFRSTINFIVLRSGSRGHLFARRRRQDAFSLSVYLFLPLNVSFLPSLTISFPSLITSFRIPIYPSIYLSINYPSISPSLLRISLFVYIYHYFHTLYYVTEGNLKLQNTVFCIIKSLNIFYVYII